MYKEKSKTRWNDFAKLAVKMECMNLGNKYINFEDKYKLVKYIVNIVPDVIHTESLPADRLMGKVDFQGKWCTTVHCNIYNDYLLRFNLLFASIFIRVHEKLFRKVDKMICCSKSLDDLYKLKGFKCESIQNGIDTNVYGLDISNKSNMRSMLNLPLNKKIILVSGSIDKRKRSIFIVETLKKHLNEFNAKLVFCGEGCDLKKCEKLSEGYDIDFRGKVDDIIPYLHTADICISASSSEGLPMSVIEAGCCGLPLVLSNIAPHMELDCNDEIEGILFFELDNAGDMIKKVNGALDNKYDTANISEYFKQNFSAAKMAAQYEKAYKEMIMSDRGSIA
jgi:glycosyltransferase involved in cell wall biosynthesis